MNVKDIENIEDLDPELLESVIVNTPEEMSQELTGLGLMPNPKIRIKDGFIIFKISEIDEYDINLDRLETAEQILSWVFQIILKPWATPELIKRFIFLAADRNGINVYI